MIRDLLVHVDGRQAGRCRVKFAADMANRMGARLTGMQVTPPTEVPPVYKPSRVEGVAASLDSALALDAKEAMMVFSEETAGRLPDTRWVEGTGDIAKGYATKRAAAIQDFYHPSSRPRGR